MHHRSGIIIIICCLPFYGFYRSVISCELLVFSLMKLFNTFLWFLSISNFMRVAGIFINENNIILTAELPQACRRTSTSSPYLLGILLVLFQILSQSHT